MRVLSRGLCFLVRTQYTFYPCDMTHVTWLIPICDMTHSYVWHDVSYIHILPMWHDSFLHVTWLIRICDMTHSYVWHDVSYIHILLMWHDSCDTTHSYMWHDSFLHVTWPMPICDITQSYMWHDVSSQDCIHMLKRVLHILITLVTGLYTHSQNTYILDRSLNFSLHSPPFPISSPLLPLYIFSECVKSTHRSVRVKSTHRGV